MIIDMMVVLIFLFQLRTAIFAGERFNLYEGIFHKQKNKEQYTKKEKKELMYVAYRFLFGIIYLIFLIYGLFTELYLYCVLTLITSTISYMLMRSATKPEISVNIRILIARGDSIIKMLIWLTPLLLIIQSVF